MAVLCSAHLTKELSCDAVDSSVEIRMLNYSAVSCRMKI